MELEKIRNLTDEELTSQQAKSAEQLFRLAVADGTGTRAFALFSEGERQFRDGRDASGAG